MEPEQVNDHWRNIRGELKKQWGKPTDGELDRIAGEKDKLVGKLQERYGITKEEAERKIKNFRIH